MRQEVFDETDYMGSVTYCQKDYMDESKKRSWESQK